MLKAIINNEIVEISQEEYDEQYSLSGPKKITEQITMRQAKLCLHRAGMLDAANASVEAMEGDAGVEARIEWNSSATLERDSPTVVKVAGDLGLPDEQVDALFTWASSL